VDHGLVNWACHTYDADMLRLARYLHQRFALNHWSRLYEYPWILRHGFFEGGQWVLDVGSGFHSPLAPVIAEQHAQIISLDLQNGWRWRQKGALDVIGDGLDLPFADGLFDRVLSVSVLEHLENYPQMIRELWRVLRPGGRLMVTFDVTLRQRWNHRIDVELARSILAHFQLPLPPLPADVTCHEFEEDLPLLPGEPPRVQVHCLCFYAEKMDQGVAL